MPHRKNLARIITWLTGAMIAAGAIILPLGFIAMQYNHTIGNLEIEAEVTAEQITKLISLNPTMWQFEEVRLETYLTKPVRGNHPERRRILDPRGEPVAEHQESLKGPLLTRAAALLDSGVMVGKVEISRSFRPVVTQGIIMLLISLAGGGLLFGFMTMAPLRALAQAERVLKSSEATYRLLIEAASDAIIVFDATSCLVIEANRRAEEMLGMSRPELLGKRQAELHPPEEAEVCELSCRPHTFLEQTAFRRELHLRGKDGALTPVEVSSSIMELQGRWIIQGIYRDITERRQAQEAIRLAKEELERQNVELKKLDLIKDSLIRDVTHELKTPVAKQSMQIEIIRGIARRQGVTDQIDEALAVMEACIKRQNATIRNILDLSRLEAGGRKYRRDSFRLDAMIREILDEYAQDFAVHGIDVRARLPEVTIISDQEMLWHVFSNVLTNAIKFCRNVARPRIDVGLASGSSGVEVVVADNGEGLSEQDKDNAFTRFYKGTPSKEGSGIGLNISQVILRNLGGTIVIDSPGKGHGATVRISLPGGE